VGNNGVSLGKWMRFGIFRRVGHMYVYDLVLHRERMGVVFEVWPEYFSHISSSFPVLVFLVPVV
jgi:hypothetical protein